MQPVQRSGVTETANPVTIVDIRMRFWSMVWFMVKWAIASIPAVIILAGIVVLMIVVSGGIIGGIATSRY